MSCTSTTSSSLVGSTSSLRRRKALADAFAGVIASLTALWVFYPLDVWKTRLQANKSLRRMDSTDHLSGLPCKTLHTLSSSFCYFLCYSWLVRIIQPRSVPKRLLVSALAAMANTFLTLPLDVLSSQQQSGTADDDDREEKNSKEEVSCLQSILSLWRGLFPSLLLSSNPAIHYTVFDTLKYRILLSPTNEKRNLNMLEAFLLGLIAKFVATMATYPLIRAKVLLMVTHQRSMLHCLVQEYRRNGTRALYQGCQLQLLHTMLKSALLMMVKERITRTTRRLVLQQPRTV